MAYKQHDEADDMPDVLIVRRVLDGHINDFALLLQRYGPYLHRIVSGMIPAAEVSELVQDVFVKAFDGLDGYDTGKKFKNWLAGIAVHTCQEHWRQHYNNRELAMSELTGEHENSLERLASGLALEEYQLRYAQQDAREILQLAMGHLSEGDRTALTLTYFEDLSLKDVAATLGCSQLTVKVRVHRARKALRKHLEILLEA